MKTHYFEDTQTAEAIMAATTPLEFKQLFKNIIGFQLESWLSMTKELYKPRISVQLTQNPSLAHQLE